MAESSLDEESALESERERSVTQNNIIVFVVQIKIAYIIVFVVQMNIIKNFMIDSPLWMLEKF